MAGKKPSVLVFKSKPFTTKPLRAVFPQLHAPDDEYSSFGVSADLLGDPDFEAQIVEQCRVTLAAAQEKLNTDKEPTNEIIRSGEYEGKPTRRCSFRMKSTRKVKGVEIEQRPRIVDANRRPMTDHVWGGSLVRIAYYIQYTITPTGTFLSLKLNAVQVIELVGPGGEVAVEDLFEEEDGFATSGEQQAPPVATGSEDTGDDVQEETDEDSTEAKPKAKSGRQF